MLVKIDFELGIFAFSEQTLEMHYRMMTKSLDYSHDDLRKLSRSILGKSLANGFVNHNSLMDLVMPVYFDNIDNVNKDETFYLSKSL